MIDPRIIRMVLGALVLASAGACSPSYEALDIDWVQGPVEGEASSRELLVPEGRLVVFRPEAQSRAGRRDYDVTNELELVSERPEVARVEQGLSTGMWMVMGVAQGSTTMEVWIDGVLEDRIPIDVVAQEVSP
jgi:hypothetical protein